jgi:hypothetical protein
VLGWNLKQKMSSELYYIYGKIPIAMLLGNNSSVTLERAGNYLNKLVHFKLFG